MRLMGLGSDPAETAYERSVPAVLPPGYSPFERGETPVAAGDGRCQHVEPAVGPSPKQYDDVDHDGGKVRRYSRQLLCPRQLPVSPLRREF